MTISNSYNFRAIDERTTTSGVVGPNRLKGLAAEGYALLINLLPDDTEHSIPDEQDIVESQGVKYVHIPVDFRQPGLADYEQFAAAMDAAQGQKKHIHCAANFRVSAFYSLYAVQRGYWDAARADAFVRDLWEPELFPGWPEFMTAVRCSPAGQ